eukprot:366245-Chlamydomonas_euryale.AAC.30
MQALMPVAPAGRLPHATVEEDVNDLLQFCVPGCRTGSLSCKLCRHDATSAAGPGHTFHTMS